MRRRTILRHCAARCGALDSTAIKDGDCATETATDADDLLRGAHESNTLGLILIRVEGTFLNGPASRVLGASPRCGVMGRLAPPRGFDVCTFSGTGPDQRTRAMHTRHSRWQAELWP